MRREFLRPTVAGNEARHRRRVLLVLGLLTLVAISPVLGHHVTAHLSHALTGQDHVWVLCLVALHELMAPVHTTFHLLLVAGVLYAVSDRVRAWFATRRVLRALDAHGPPAASATWQACQASGVPIDVVRIARGLPNPAFTTGWLRPSIYIDARLEQDLEVSQLATVLLHEYAHVLRRDPARLTLLRALGCVLFWLPALRRLARDVADDAEIAADTFAAQGDPVVLASAILRLAHWPPQSAVSGTRHAIVGFQRDAMLDRRIHRLLGNDAPIVTHVTWRSIVGATAGLLLAWTSGIAVAHPMTAGSAHCAHEHERPYQHLFCLVGAHARTARALCPHETAPLPS